MVSGRFVTRFAPSPTGYLHRGHAFAALNAHVAAREAGGRFLLRMEDIDTIRCRPEFDAAIANAAPKAEDGGGVAVPQNLVPYIRLAIADQLEHETDRITMDVIALLFDYVFRDPSIPASLRELFGRLQVPVVKVGLLDRTFFSDREHPARKFIDHLASAAIGATGDARYFDAFQRTATAVVDDVCYSFEIDVAAFAQADRKLTAFIESEARSTETAAGPDVATALANESQEEDRSAVRAQLRDKLGGIEVPFEVRSFTETVWADFLASVRKRDGAASEALARGLKTVDDLLWSITAMERTAQKNRFYREPAHIKTASELGLGRYELSQIDHRRLQVG